MCNGYLDEWTDKSLRQLAMRSKYGVNVMAIKKGNDINISPSADDVIEKGDILVVIGGIEELGAIERSR